MQTYPLAPHNDNDKIHTPLFVSGYNDIAEAGFPNVLCPVIFLEGCNFKCPYCLNVRLVLKENLKKIPIKFIINEYKEENKILISGGEPLFHENIYEIIDFLKNNGFSVRISTNGSFPDILKNLIDKKMISFVAMDIKTGFNLPNKWVNFSLNPNIKENILKSIDILNKKDVDFEFRTTLFPELVNKKDIISIANQINKESNWFLQQFRLKNKLLGGNFIGKTKPYEKETLQEFLDTARQLVKNTRIRYV